MSATTTYPGFYVEDIHRRVHTIAGAPTSTITYIGCIKHKRRCAHILVADDPDSQSTTYIRR
jgi:hypothetical protein